MCIECAHQDDECLCDQSELLTITLPVCNEEQSIWDQTDSCSFPNCTCSIEYNR